MEYEHIQMLGEIASLQPGTLYGPQDLAKKVLTMPKIDPNNEGAVRLFLAGVYQAFHNQLPGQSNANYHTLQEFRQPMYKAFVTHVLSNANKQDPAKMKRITQEIYNQEDAKRQAGKAAASQAAANKAAANARGAAFADLVLNGGRGKRKAKRGTRAKKLHLKKTRKH